jgi:hypothetical protein
LDETFAIYSRHFWRFAGLVATVQVPIGIFSLAVDRLAGGREAAVAVIGMLSALATVVVYGAAVSAIGQQYLDGAIGVRRSYRRATWRLISLVLISLVVVLIVLVPMVISDEPGLVMLATLMSIPAIALGIYWSMAVQAVIVEGLKTIGALKRSFGLVRGSWWRVFGVSLVFGLVAFGLAIVVTIPFLLPSLIGGYDVDSGLGVAIRFLNNVVVEIAILPVLFISGTLLYYDLRVRKEQYDLSVLSREMGIGKHEQMPASR